MRLAYDRNRYYDRREGRFTQEDPIGLAGGINLYGYAGGDPANSSDPFGLRACDDNEGKEVPCPEPAGGPPVPLPDGRTWKPAAGPSTPGKGGDSRGRRWVPSSPIPGGVPQPGGSWDPDGHWDDIPGTPGRRRFAPDGIEVGHDGERVVGPQQFPTPSAAQVQATAAAGITYWIVSESLRFLFPPRNLIPVP
jgi:hypothetical protein